MSQHYLEALTIEQTDAIQGAVEVLRNLVNTDVRSAINPMPVTDGYELHRNHVIALMTYMTSVEKGTKDHGRVDGKIRLREGSSDLSRAVRGITMVINELDDGLTRRALEDAVVFILEEIDEIDHPVLRTKKQNILARIVNGQKEGVSILGGYVDTPAAVEHGQGPESDETYAQVRLGIEGTDYILSLRKADE